jgi:folate-binding protein YgfZ
LPSQFSLLSGETLLHISGPDSLTFLQGQATCDTRQLRAGHALPGAFCTPQGRVICDFLLAQLGEEHFALRMRRDISHQAAATLGRYIVFSRAELEGENQNWQVYGCWGPEAKDALNELAAQPAGVRSGTAADTGLVLVQVDTDSDQFECYVDMSVRPRFGEELARRLETGSESTWRRLQILAGLGRIEAPTMEQFVPQMLNYDLTGHISFNKGCYTGQEVVARLHYRGRPKRRLYLVRFAADAPPPAGTELYTPGTEQSVGNLVNASVEPDGAALALVVATAAGVAGSLRLGSPDGPVLEIGELPYKVENG